MPVLKKNLREGFACSKVGVLGTRISTLKLSISDLTCIDLLASVYLDTNLKQIIQHMEIHHVLSA